MSVVWLCWFTELMFFMNSLKKHQPILNLLNPLRHLNFHPTVSINLYWNPECCCVIWFYKTVKPHLASVSPFAPVYRILPPSFSLSQELCPDCVLHHYHCFYFFVIFERFVAKIRTCHWSNADVTIKGDALHFWFCQNTSMVRHNSLDACRGEEKEEEEEEEEERSRVI